MLKVGIVGGGASGFFAAIKASELFRKSKTSHEVRIFEASPHFLKKVKISGGGRCNVTHNIFETNKFAQNYPRGNKELKSPFKTFQAKDTIEWFSKRGIEIVAEADGRMFPVSNNSQTIIDCFLDEASKNGVIYEKGFNVQEIEKTELGKYSLSVRNADEYVCDKVLIATGSSPVGYRLAKSLGHKITDLAPSLFSFKLEDSLLQDLSGTSFKTAKVHIKIENEKKNFKQEGPILITHWGLSGPAILKISAWAARELKQSDYKGKLIVNWLGLSNSEEAFEYLKKIKDEKAKMLIKNSSPEGLTKAFWESLIRKVQINLQKKWVDFSHKEMRKLSEYLVRYEFDIKGKNRYKDEFVECGGVSLKEINFKTMESKISNGLFFAGEILDIDGITGGFNFQNAWTTAWLAAHGIALRPSLDR